MSALDIPAGLKFRPSLTDVGSSVKGVGGKKVKGWSVRPRHDLRRALQVMSWEVLQDSSCAVESVDLE